jgi:hypothetical protein
MILCLIHFQCTGPSRGVSGSGTLHPNQKPIAAAYESGKVVGMTQKELTAVQPRAICIASGSFDFPSGASTVTTDATRTGARMVTLPPAGCRPVVVASLWSLAGHISLGLKELSDSSGSILEDELGSVKVHVTAVGRSWLVVAALLIQAIW